MVNGEQNNDFDAYYYYQTLNIVMFSTQAAK
jgi:hypothetical protein